MHRVASVVFLFLLPIVCPCAAAGTQGRNQILVSTAWLAHTPHDSSLVILQVARDRTSYDRGHIPGARLLMLGDIVVSRDGNDNELPAPKQLKKAFEAAGVSNSSRIVLYDDAQGLLAARAYFTLDYLGMGDRTALLNGGLSRWIADGGELAHESPSFIPGKIKLSLRPGIVASHSQVRGLSLAKEAVSRSVLVDARSPEQFGALTPAASSHIPGARNVFWMNTLESASNPVFRQPPDLRIMYNDAGVKPGTRVVVYCNTGMQASHTYFTLKWLGFDVALYDGSFQDWARNSATTNADTSSK